MEKVMQCLVDELRESGNDNRFYEILRFLAEDKLKALKNGDSEAREFTRRSLMQNVVGGSEYIEKDPSRWLPKGGLEKYLAGKMPSLSRRLRSMGLKQRPAIITVNESGGNGLQKGYSLSVEPLTEENSEQTNYQLEESVEYCRSSAGEVRPSFLINWIFTNGELRNNSFRGFWLVTFVLVLMIIQLLYLTAGVYGLTIENRSLSMKDLVQLSIFAGTTYLLWRQFCEPWVKVVDHRVTSAPISLLRWNESTAQIEMHVDSERIQWTRFVRFTADCPICKGRIEVKQGKPDHRIPLVGRCIESPFAHVFSFDRTLLRGFYIGPPRVHSENERKNIPLS